MLADFLDFESHGLKKARDFNRLEIEEVQRNWTLPQLVEVRCWVVSFYGLAAASMFVYRRQVQILSDYAVSIRLESTISSWFVFPPNSP